MLQFHFWRPSRAVECINKNRGPFLILIESTDPRPFILARDQLLYLILCVKCMLQTYSLHACCRHIRCMHVADIFDAFYFRETVILANLAKIKHSRIKDSLQYIVPAYVLPILFVPTFTLFKILLRHCFPIEILE